MDSTRTPPVSRKCQQAGCSFAEDGTCLEGIVDPLQCPHLESPREGVPQLAVTPDAVGPSDEDRAGIAEEDEVPIENWLPLPDGYELSISTASHITGAQDALLVVLAGEPDAGKTTLIAALYEMISDGPFASLRFAGSETLLAFERACHLSRTSSEAEVPDTERTKGLHGRFFHLVLQDLSNDELDQHLLLTDVSGEAYRRATNHSDDAKKLSFIRRANAFVLLLDGERLASKSERQEAFRRGLLLLRSLTEVGMLDNRSSVMVALSKFDLLQHGFVDQNTLDFVEYVKSEFQKFSDRRYRTFAIIEIASRPLPGRGLSYAHGLDTLIRSWLQWQPIPVEHPRLMTVDMPCSGRESDLFLWRHFAK